MLSIDDSYTGHVSSGSAAQRRQVPGVSIVKMSVGPMDNNTYLVQCAETGEALLIDAANEADRILDLVAQGAPGKVRAILTTHQHPDHWQALSQVAAEIKAPTAAHRLDAHALPVPPDRLLDQDDILEIGNLRLKTIHLQGHTPGSIALALTDNAGGIHLFTGDSLFPGGVGKTPNAEAFGQLLRDVTTKLFDPYPDSTAVYPGHGDDTTLGTERPHLAEWRERRW